MNEVKSPGVVRFPVTASGYNKMKEELENLVSKERHEVIAAIAEARAHGDLSENAEYHAAKEKQGMIEAKIADLNDKIARSEVIDFSNVDRDKVQFGATVKMLDHETGREVQYKIVGDYEADIRLSHISVYSPVAKAMMTKRVGDEIEVETPNRTRYYEIISIEYV